jgi:hypothetical protein
MMQGLPVFEYPASRLAAMHHSTPLLKLVADKQVSLVLASFVEWSTTYNATVIMAHADAPFDS